LATYTVIFFHLLPFSTSSFTIFFYGADWALTPKNVSTQKAVKRSKTFTANYRILPHSEKALGPKGYCVLLIVKSVVVMLSGYFADFFLL
jgi:hypothetical protein